MTVTLSQKSYDALLDDLEKLRERNAELERKLDKEVKLSYEIEGNLYDVSKERDKIINDMAEVKRKAEAWIDLKKEMAEMYPVLVNDVEITNGECEKGMLYQLGKHLRRMDELDGTNDFKNLLSDLERGSDE
ncbi:MULTISPECIES: hypothetical protein [Staphylococcus]|uniref:Uncharacterized protein n=1 Tax=Staphylococcus haemolyticus (strain JCSC1435) TaxID=279808 RepID=Q4L3U8_STAHJ|nr:MULTISPECIES: hypothetical protein [Staphylococcus]BAE05679.1 unnamed protein product [Staphylococcus haemolyticus JCSC1435]